MKKSIDEESMELLCDAVLSLKNRDEFYKFFKDICTVQELKSISQRIQVARLLKQDVVYAKIVELTGASTATISRVKRSLEEIDGHGGYDIVFDRLKDKNE